MTAFVPRTKNDRLKLVDNRTTVNRLGNAVTLACGHPAVGPPTVTSPDRWWCCGSWQGRRR